MDTTCTQTHSLILYQLEDLIPGEKLFMRRRDTSDRARPPCVRWEDEVRAVDQQRELTSTRPRQLSPSLRLRPISGALAGEPLASQSAAATLSMYLSDALGDDNRTKRGDIRSTLTRRSQPGERTGMDTSFGDVGDPGSPLTRFLRKRSQVPPRPSARESLGVSPRVSRQDLFARAAVPSPSLISHSGSMERLLMENIHEAKRMRQHRSIGQENKPPTNDATSPPSINGLAENPDHASTDVPIPHPKPQNPVLAGATLCTPSATQRVELLRVELPSAKHPSPVEVALAATRAAHQIQHAWRSNRLHQRQVEEKEEEKENKDLMKKDTTSVVQSAACGGDTSTGPMQTNDELSQTTAEETEATTTSHREIDSELSPATILDEQEEAPLMGVEVNSARAVRWLDDECVFLEEGRFPTYELLDVSAHQDDQSVDTLVWTKPHVIVAMQETSRRQRDRARRAHRHQRVQQIQDDAEDANAPSSVAIQTARRQQQQRPQPQRRRRQVRIVLPKNRSQRWLGGGRIQIGYCPKEADTTSKLSASVRSSAETMDDPGTRLLRELSRYVVFSAHEPSDDASRNDLIGVSGAMSLRDDEDEEQNHSDDGNARDGGDLHVVSRIPCLEDGAVLSFADQDETAERSVVISTNLSISSSMDICSAIPGDCRDEFPYEMCDVEMHVHPHRTPERTPRIPSQSQLYSQDQQRLIDAYATDAVLTTFFSPPLSPVDSYQSHVQTLAISTAITTTRSTTSAHDDQASNASPPRPTLDACKQQEFLQALDDFRQSLGSSMASTPRTGSDGLLLPTSIALDLQGIHSSAGDARGNVLSSFATNMDDRDEDLDSLDSDSDDDAADMDAELQAMLMEIQRCKTQIASARQLPAVPAESEP